MYVYMSISKSKVKLTTTLDADLMKWVEERIDDHVFATKSHAIERGLEVLREKHGDGK